MIKKGETTCPKCGGKLKYYDSIRRLVKGSNGRKYFITIDRYICKKCHSTHRVIPDKLLPYKHYEKDIIRGFIEGEKSSYDLEYEDYPSESVINEWIRTQKKHPFL